MKEKILNTDDNDKLNAMADVRNYGAGSEFDEDLTDLEDEPEIADSKEDEPEIDADLKEDEPLPDEIAFPEEQEEEDEVP